jgi:hypothetical protein
MTEEQIANIQLPPTGDRVLTPPLRSGRDRRYRIRLEGVYRFEPPKLGSEEFDALYRTGQWGPFSRRHEYLDWSPVTPSLVSEDAAAHRYVFEIPAGAVPDGSSLGVRLNVDRFVNEYLITPSEVRSALHGELRAAVVQVSPAPVSLWGALAWTAVPTAVLAGGLGFVLRRRMALRGIPDDLQEAVLAIDRKYRTARAASGSGHARLFPLHDRLSGLRRGAFELAREVHALRAARSGLDRPSLEREVAALEARTASLADPDAARESWSLLRERQKSLELLADLERVERLAGTRLERISAALDTACLTLRSGQLKTADPQGSELLHSLDAELAALREVRLPS